MTRTHFLRLGAAVLALGAILATGLWRMTEARTDASADRDKERRPAATAPRAKAVEPGLVLLDKDDLARAGIEVAPVRAAAMQPWAHAYATVIDPARLTDLANAYVAAKAQLDAAAAKAQASRQAYVRARSLYEDDQNTSLAQLQAAEAAARADGAAVAAARAQVVTAQAAAAQELGPVLARDVGGGPVQSLIQRRSLLVQITPPPGEGAATAPGAATVETPGGRQVAVRLVGAAPHVDPKLQAMSFYYLAPATPGLLPGMNLTAWVPMRAGRSGVAVPSAAVVSWQGMSWVYVQSGAGRFRRVSLGSGVSAEADGTVTDALQPGTIVVMGGAQLLLSQETRPQGKAEAGED